jgi:hypothetical protein
MTTKGIVVLRPERLVQKGGTRGAISTATKFDQYSVAGRWYPVGEFATWQDRQSVDAISQAMGEFQFAVGDILAVEGFDRHVYCHVEVQHIKMVTLADLTDADIDAMGYRDRDQWLEETDGGLKSRHGWFFTLAILQDVLPDETAPDIASPNNNGTIHLNRYRPES